MYYILVFDRIAVSKSAMLCGSGNSVCVCKALGVMTDSPFKVEDLLGDVMGTIGGYSTLADSLKTAEGLVTFDEQLEEVVGSGLDKNSFKAIMEALAK